MSDSSEQEARDEKKKKAENKMKDEKKEKGQNIPIKEDE
jgi:hypothetical protein